ncbi:hypothetical protein, conserved [Angomonas deanei]|uniref:Uncharacterized protein n=1 Tax=Angomonas deanei TaxID=59799 RepID=A0A7G2CPG9_9TRYP|nr:hypothetical protein, conserved [Angomonas deanei]
MGNEIQRVNVHQDRFLVAYTSTTILVGDLISCKLSEVPWQLTGKESYVFDNPQVCMIFTAGELSLIEYGKNQLLGTCRTEERNAHRISVRVHDPSPDSELEQQPRRVIAFLIDRETIQVDDLVSGMSVARISHTCKIDWLELNYQANKLLYRDKQHQLFLYDIGEQERKTLLNYCTYVQWVPGSDVVVAQNRVELCVWYSINNPDRVAVVAIKGEVEGIERGNGKTEVIVDEGVTTVAYGLDESMIEFGTAMEQKDYNRACELLEGLALTPETEVMWTTLSQIAMQELKLKVAERCFAALGDIARVTALQNINEMASKASKESKGATDGYDHYTVQAGLAILNKDFKRAERIYLENGKVEEAINMWEEMNRFDESLAVAEQRNLDDVATRRARYFSWLMETRQYEKAGLIKEKEGKHIDAINLYLRGGTPARAANVVNENDLKPEQQLLEAIAAALFKAQVFEKAGDFFEKLHLGDRAIDAYKRGHVFSRAVEYAQRNDPEKVPKLEEEWGDFLVSQKHVDQAINHYCEAEQYFKAVKAAISSRQWGKAADILESQNLGAKEDGTIDSKIVNCYKAIAKHYEDMHQYTDAEKFYVKAGAVNDAVEMYSRAGLADQMYRVAQRHLDQQQLVTLFVAQAKQLEAKEDYAGAERIYLKVNDPDQAIVMYKRTRDFTNMIRLVQSYRPDFLLKTHLSLGAQFEKENNFKLAETHYVAGKDWARAVNMYREREMWDDAVRVAKVHGGANASKQVVLSRAMVLDAEEGLHLLSKFGFAESGIDAALDAYKFDLALQWAQAAQPAKLPYVYLKQAMYYEDQGDFRMAEEAFVKSQKPREAIDMYVHQHDFTSAMRVAENYDPSAVPQISAANGRVCFQQGNYKEAEELFLRANAPEALLKLYIEGRMFNDAQRLAKEHCPEMQGEVAKRIALQSNDPQKAGAVLEENGEYQLAIDAYMGATAETVEDPAVLANLWVRAVKVAHKHQRNSLKEVLKVVVPKLKENQRYVEAGRCLEDVEDYKGAITLYVQGKKFEMAEALAKRISPELEDFVKRAIVQDSIEGGHMRDAKVVEEMDPEAALKTYLANNDFPNALRMAKQKSKEEHHYVSGLELQYHVRQNDIPTALEVLTREELDPEDFRFYATWVECANQLVLTLLPSDTLDLTLFHRYFVKVAASMSKSGQQNEDVAQANALSHVIHIYHMSRRMQTEWGLGDFALQLMLGLPRWVPHIPADKAFYDAGLVAKEKGASDIAFLYLNRALDIVEKIEDGDKDSSGIDNNDFALTDFPKVYRLPKKATIAKEKMEEINNWVLTESIDVHANPDRKLPVTNDPQSNEEMFAGSLVCPSSGNTFPECAVTGYPIFGTQGVSKCGQCGRNANQNDWNKFLMVAKQCPWCEHPESPDFSM